MPPTLLLNKKVKLFHPDPERSEIISGTIVGWGFSKYGPMYLVDLDEPFCGVLHPDSIYEQTISMIPVHKDNVIECL